MQLTFRAATSADLPAILALLEDDVLGQTRENADPSAYAAAMAEIEASRDNVVLVGQTDTGRIVATCQLTFIPNLSLGATRRAQVEAVRVASDLRGLGLGAQLFREIETRARAAGCGLVQLTMNTTRQDAARFYQGLGFTPSHIGFKRYLD